MTKRQVEYKKEVRKQVSGRKINARLDELGGDWRAGMLSRFRILIKQADPKVVEEVKWIKPTNPLGTAVWSHDGLVCTFEIYKDHVRLTFAKGASLNDPKGIFNASLEGNAFRAIVLKEGEKIDEPALKTIIRAAVGLNVSSAGNK